MDFRKRIRVGKYFYWNLSKSGISASVGRPGATVNVGKDGVRGTVGLPGTGLSHRTQLVSKAAMAGALAAPPFVPDAAKADQPPPAPQAMARAPTIAPPQGNPARPEGGKLSELLAFVGVMGLILGVLWAVSLLVAA